MYSDYDNRYMYSDYDNRYTVVMSNIIVMNKVYLYLQSNLFIPNTSVPNKTVLIIEVSLFRGTQ